MHATVHGSRLPGVNERDRLAVLKLRGAIGSESTSPTKPEDVNLEDGTDEHEEPVENPAG
jgi:hypothetical protein